jgi:hexosaminidase
MNRCRLVVQVLLLQAVAAGASAQESAGASLNVVPQPVSVRYLNGPFRLDEDTRIVASSGAARRVAEQFNERLLDQHGVRLPVVGARVPGHSDILFSSAASRDLPPEGYHIAIAAKGIRVSGQGAGLYYGMQTLAQLLPQERARALVLPAVVITDYPRFGYRGLLIDVGRHFFPVSSIKKYLDLAAQYKINTFHWHLTDDEGWRIEIRRYPKLTAPASRQVESPPGYYTQAQVREIVAYAQARYITVIPEIEMPGHAGAALEAYPELACTPGAHENVYCPRDSSFAFLQQVLGEVIALFPGPYVHIGGDEVSKEGWRRSAEAQAIMKRHSLKNEDELQSYFVRRMVRFLASRGKRTIGWDEILDGGLAPGAIVMSWRGESGGIEAVKEGHLAIMAPSEYCYFDYGQGDPRREPANIGGFIPLDKVYRYEPIPRQLASPGRKFILGIQANVWTEYIATPEYLEYMLFPRLLAFAEVAWSPEAGRRYENFRSRLPFQLAHLDARHVSYRIPEPAGLHDLYTTSDDQAIIELRADVPGSLIRYTLDGSEPGETSPRYLSPIRVPLPLGQSTRLNLDVVAPSGRRSVVYGATFLRRAPLDAKPYGATQPGLSYAVFDGRFHTVQGVGQGAPSQSGYTHSLDLQQFGRSLDYGIRFEGYLRVPLDDFYRFAVESDDGAVLRIDDEVVVDNDGEHASRELIGYIPLQQGFHKLQLSYFQAQGGATLRVGWAGAHDVLQPLEGSALFH